MKFSQSISKCAPNTSLTAQQLDEIRCFVLNRTNYKNDYEDFIQEAFLKILEKEPDLLLNNVIMGKIINYCKWHLFNRNRMFASRNKHLCYLPDDVLNHIHTEANYCNYLELEKNMYLDSVKTKKERAVLKHLFEGYTCVEIAKMLNLSKDQVFRLVKKIRSQLWKSK